jgi:Zn-dependent metalloprotease
MASRSTRFLQTALSVLVLACATSRAEAQKQALRLNPVRSTTSVATRTIPSTSPHPKAASLAAALRNALQGMAARAQLSRMSPARQTDDTEVRIRPGVGTPILLRGTALQPASGTGGGASADATTARDFLRAHRSLLRLDDPDAELADGRRAVDERGRRHLWFSQSYAGLPVWPAELVVHLDPAGNVDLLDGAFVPTPHDVDLHPLVDSASAAQRARLAVPGAAQAATSAPELIVYAPVDRAPRLAWKVEVNASLAERRLVIVDAKDGSVADSIDLIHDANVLGAGLDVFGVERPINVFQQGGTFFLVDTSKPMFNPLSTPPALEATFGGIVILDARNDEPDGAGRIALAQITSNNARSWSPRDGVSASFGLSETYDYYLERHARDSLDGRGGTMLGIVRFSRDFQNAFWNGTAMVFGDGLPFAGALDVVAHELTHGVTQFSANLVYQNQSGALNEAFSDIFGEMVEARTRGEADFLKGADLGEPFQNYADPGSVEIFPGAGRGNPATMSELIPPDDPFLNNFQGRDSGGVHINSAIINHAYFLLSEGLDAAIGLADAEKIFYRALTVHLVANSQFIDLRYAAIQSAEELFGAGSAQARATAAAFDAVEIFDDVRPPTPTPFPEVQGPDATLFVFRADEISFALGRREEALGDEPQGTRLTEGGVAAARPSVSGDGEFAAFVNADNDVCLIPTDGSEAESCLGFTGFVSSVAVAPSGNRFGFVLLDDAGNPVNAITVIDIGGEQARTFPLDSPGLDGGGLNNVLFADAMDFTADGRLLIYDALNVATLTDGSSTAAWSIYGLDIDDATTAVVVPPLPGVDIEFPVLSQTSDNFITFEAFDQESGISTVLAGNLLTGELSSIGSVAGLAAPCYTGDDQAIVYSQADDGSPTGFSLVRQPLADDRITPAGDPAPWLEDGFLGIIYRRGEFTGPRLPGICVGDCSANGLVTTNEIVLGINVALGQKPLDACRTFDADRDGAISIAELLKSVVDAMDGC